jgi:hypothetical protein
MNFSEEDIQRMFDEYVVASGLNDSLIRSAKNEADRVRRLRQAENTFRAKLARGSASEVLFTDSGRPVTLGNFVQRFSRGNTLVNGDTGLVDRAAGGNEGGSSQPLPPLTPGQRANIRLTPVNPNAAVEGTGVADMRETNARARELRDNPAEQAKAIEQYGGVQRGSNRRITLNPGERLVPNSTGQTIVQGSAASVAQLPPIDQTTAPRPGTMSWTDSKGNVIMEDENGNRTRRQYINGQAVDTPEPRQVGPVQQQAPQQADARQTASSTKPVDTDIEEPAQRPAPAPLQPVTQQIASEQSPTQAESKAIPEQTPASQTNSEQSSKKRLPVRNRIRPVEPEPQFTGNARIEARRQNARMSLQPASNSQQRPSQPTVAQLPPTQPTRRVDWQAANAAVDARMQQEKEQAQQARQRAREAEAIREKSRQEMLAAGRDLQRYNRQNGISFMEHARNHRAIARPSYRVPGPLQPVSIY